MPGHFFSALLAKLRQVTNARELPRNVDIYSHCDWSFLLSLLVFKIGSFAFPFGIIFPLACLGIVVSLHHKNQEALFLVLYVLVYCTHYYGTSNVYGYVDSKHSRW